MNESIRVEMFGCLTLVVGGARITRFRSRKIGTLLAYLASHPGRDHSRDALIGLLWPDAEPEAARLNLRVALASLRRLIESPGVPHGSILHASRLAVRLNPGALHTDIQEMEQALHDASKAETDGEAATLLERALGLYKGPFLPDSFDDWAMQERDRLALIRLKVAERLSEIRIGQDAPEAALPPARIVAEEKPFDDAAHQRLASLLLRCGLRNQAAECVRRFRQILADELGAEPSEAIQALEASLPSARLAPLPSEGMPALEMKAQRPLSAFPPRLTRFFGREQECERLLQLLNDGSTRLITLLGPGGCGKTRLLLEVLEKIGADPSRVVWFADFSSLESPELAAAALAEVLGVGPEDRTHPEAAILSKLAYGDNLLALDNVEQLLGHAGFDFTAFVQRLLAGASKLTCVVTSRQVLGISGEQELRLGPLEVPADGLAPSELAGMPCVGLFVDRARLVQPDFAITPRNAAPLIRLCRRLEGMPLAIELAAAWSHTLTPAQLAERLGAKESILVSRRPGGPERHRSVQSASQWSFRLLPADLREILSKLSVFRGGWSMEAAIAITGRQNAAADLAELNDRSLVWAEEVAGVRRFRLLESVREFAAEGLSTAEAIRLGGAHARYFEGFAENCHALLRTVWQGDAQRRVDQEQDNVRAALAWSLEQAPSLAVRLMCLLSPFWEHANRDAEAVSWLERMEAIELSDPADRAAVRIALAKFHTRNGAYEYKRNLLGRALEDAVRVGRTDLEAAAYYCYGHAYFLAADVALPRRWFEWAAEKYEQAGQSFGVIASLSNFAELCSQAGQMDEAQSIWERALALSRSTGDLHNEAVMSGNLGELALYRGKYAESRKLTEKSLWLSEKLHDQTWQASCLLSLGRVAVCEGRLDDAAQAFRASHRLFTKRPDLPACALAQCGLAEVDRLMGNTKRAEARFLCVVDDPLNLGRAEILARVGLARLSPRTRELCECLGPLSRLGHRGDLLDAIELAALRVAGRSPESARELLRGCESIRASIGHIRDPLAAPTFSQAVSVVGEPGQAKEGMDFGELLVRARDAL